jgi:hypothetical protein
MKITNIQKSFLQSEYGRKWLIKKALEAVPKDKNWQKNHTPYDLCDKMIKKSTSVEDKKILVLFNIEFIEVLVNQHRVSTSNIYFAADCNIESIIAKKVYGLSHAAIVKNMNDLKKFYSIEERK